MAMPRSLRTLLEGTGLNQAPARASESTGELDEFILAVGDLADSRVATTQQGVEEGAQRGGCLEHVVVDRTQRRIGGTERGPFRTVESRRWW